MTIATLGSDQARLLLDARGPFASVYFDDSHDAPDAAKRLESTWQDIRRGLEEQGADAALVTVVEGAVRNARAPVGRSGRGIIATADGVLIDEQLLLAPTRQVVRVSDLPYVVPIVEVGSDTPTYIVVAIDQIGAEVSLHHGDVVHTETVEGGGHPVHEVAGAAVHGWNDPRHRVEEAIRKNVRAVAKSLTEQCDRHRPEVVFLVGHDRVRAELMAMLPQRVEARVVRPRVGARNTGEDDNLRQAIALEFQNRRRLMSAEVARRYRATLGPRAGLTVSGLPEVCAALREDAVDTLILGDLADEVVLTGQDLTLVATDADSLSAFGSAATHTLRADEAIPFAALAGGAALVRADESLDLLDGVAALLRYPPTGSSASRQ